MDGEVGEGHEFQPRWLGTSLACWLDYVAQAPATDDKHIKPHVGDADSLERQM